MPKNGSLGGWRSVLRMKVQIENIAVPNSANEGFSWRMEVSVEDESAKREHLSYLRVPKNGSHGGWRC